MQRFLSESAAQPSLMLNGEIDHHEYPNNEEEVETPVSHKTNRITELEDFKPSLDTPGDPQVVSAWCHLDLLISVITTVTIFAFSVTIIIAISMQ